MTAGVSQGRTNSAAKSSRREGLHPPTPVPRQLKQSWGDRRRDDACRGGEARRRVPSQVLTALAGSGLGGVMRLYLKLLVMIGIFLCASVTQVQDEA